MLRDSHGWEIHWWFSGPTTDAKKAEYPDHLDLFDVIESAKSAPVPTDIIERCKHIEEKYDLNLADVLSADRHLGIGWVLGGIYHRGKLSHMPYEKHLHLIYEVFTAFEKFVSEVNPAMICFGGVGSYPPAVVCAVAERFGVPTYGLTRTTFGLYYWQIDRFASIPGIEDTYARLKAEDHQPVDVDLHEITDYTRSRLPEASQTGTLRHLVGKLLRTIVREARLKVIGNTRSGEFWTRMSYAIQVYRGFKREMRRDYVTVDELDGKDFVFYPLHMEPEASLTGMEPHFTNQTFAIELLSKAVPVGMHVVVKEHWNSVGVRPAGWIDIIAGFPRVKLAHPFDSSVEIMRRSIAVATIGGTGGVEAAMMGKPVVAMGPNYRYSFVDHIWFANDLISLRKLFRRIHDNRSELDFAREGVALETAIEKVCFRPQQAFTYALKPLPPPADIELACNELLTLVNGHQLTGALTADGRPERESRSSA